MLICVEGCIGVGKTTLVKALSKQLKNHSLFEEYDNNPFLMDFYQNQDYYALHVQTTFMFLQERQINRASNYLDADELVISDFHPIKSKVFAQIVLSDIDRPLVLGLYDRLFQQHSQPDLLILLIANTDIILHRIHKRNDPFTQNISPAYIDNVSTLYKKFFASYAGNLLTIDTSNIDFNESPDDLVHLINQVNAIIDITPYLKTGL